MSQDSEQGSSGASKSYDELDTNKDGVVSTEELEARYMDSRNAILAWLQQNGTNNSQQPNILEQLDNAYWNNNETQSVSAV